MTHEEFMKIVRAENERMNHPEKWTEAERLKERFRKSGKSDEEWFQLAEDMRKFYEHASAEDRKALDGYSEGVQMACSGIKYRREKDGKE